MFTKIVKTILLAIFLSAILILVGCPPQKTPPPEEKQKGDKVSLEIVSPKNQETVEGSTVSVEVKVEGVSLVEGGGANDPQEGHLHFTLDNETKVGLENIAEFTNVSSGSHTLTVELLQNDHSSRSPAVKKEITFTVSGGTSGGGKTPQDTLKVSFTCQHHGGTITVSSALNEICPGCGCGKQTKICKSG